jgi:TolB protein
MGRTLTFSLAALAAAIGGLSAGEPAKLVAFERGSDIWIANLDGSKAAKITKGSGPDLSPDGKRIAFNTDTSTSKEVIRQIALADVATKKVTVFKNEIPSQNCQRAIWSPDGRQILFSIWDNADWHLALFNADGTGFRFVKRTQNRNSLWSYCWAADGRSIYAQDLNTLYLLDLEGGELNKWTLQSLFPNGSFNSGSTFAVSNDGQKMLMEVDMDNEQANLPDWEGPPPSVWVLNLKTQQSRRLTPKGVLASHPSWVDPEHFVFASQNGKEKNPSIFIGSLTGPDHKVVIRNGSNPSAR